VMRSERCSQNHVTAGILLVFVTMGTYCLYYTHYIQFKVKAKLFFGFSKVGFLFPAAYKRYLSKKQNPTKHTKTCGYYSPWASTLVAIRISIVLYIWKQDTRGLTRLESSMLATSVWVHVSQDLKSREEQKQGRRTGGATFQLKRLSRKVQSIYPSIVTLDLRTRKKDAKCCFVHVPALAFTSDPCLFWLHRKAKSLRVS